MPRNWEYRDCTACGSTFRFQSAPARSFVGSGIWIPLEVIVADLFGSPTWSPPCPECGCLPRVEVARRKRLWHTGVGLAVLAWFILTGAAGGSPETVGVSFTLAGELLGDGAIVGLWLHATVALTDPNRHQERNLRQAKRLASRGQLELDSGPDATMVYGPPRVLTRWAVVPLAVGSFGALMAFAPLALTAFTRWPVSPDTKPEVVSPGDTVRVWFPEKVSALHGHWAGTPRAVLVGPDGPTPLPASSQMKFWGSTIGGKDSYNKLATLWADVALPDDPRLVGSTIKVQVDMAVEYPSANGSTFDTVEGTMTATRRYTLAAPGASAAYPTAFVVALVGAGLVSACGFVLWGMEGGLRRIPPG